MNKYDSYYPRPLLRRDSFLSLNGQWLLNGKPINVPFAPESDEADYKGDLNEIVYTKTFTLPDGFLKENQKVILHFGAVDQICDVYLNDSHMIHHEGGYLPFKIDITEHLNDENHLKVVCIDNLDFYYPYGKQCKEPHGMWYTPVSGIWQSVWLEAYDKNGIDDLKIHTDMNTLSLHIESNSKSFEVSFNDYAETFNTNDIEIKIDNPHLWDTEDPYLYDLTIKTDNDVIHSYFALREIKNKNNRLYLNDKPLFLTGLLDQGYFPEGIYTPSDPQEYETDVKNMKELGFNTLRKHIKVEMEAFYYYCDKLGMLVIQDMVNTGKYSFIIDSGLPNLHIFRFPKPLVDKRRYDFFIKHASETIDHLKSHPCIIAYTIYNEGWGQQAASKAYEALKPLDPTRLFDSTSGWFFDNKTDFDSYHIYFRNAVLEKGSRLLLLSECGGFKRKILDHQSEKGSEWGYGEAFSEDELMDRIDEMKEKMLIPSIKNGMVGYIYTQVSDVEGECNGIYTYDRKICKVNKQRMKDINKQVTDLYNNI